MVGLFNSIMFPTIFTLGIAQLGPLTGKGSGVLMAAAVGGAIIPVVQGAFADASGVQPSFIVPAICYSYVAFYGFEGLPTSILCDGFDVILEELLSTRMSTVFRRNRVS